MFRNFFKITIRNLWKNKTFSLINISGLALGLAVFILIMLWVKSEMSYDGFHKDKDRIAMTMTNQIFGNKEIQTLPAVPTMLAESMKKDLPAVEYSALVSWGDQRMFTYGEKHFIEYGLYVGADFLKIFSFPLLKGDAEKVLREPNMVLISEKLTKKYFSEEDPVGKMISIEKTLSYKVEGVLKDVPENATVKFDFLIPVKDYIDQTMSGKKSWEFGNIRTYVKLKEGVNRSALDASLKKFMGHYTDKQKNAELALFNLNDWYLRWDFKNGKYAGGGKITYVKLFTVIAVFILLLACINFMNLSTARATQRSKEVGIRKVIGAGKQSLITQFIGESIIMSVIAALFAVVIVSLTIPVFNTLLNKHITFDYTGINNWLVLASIVLITGLLAGSYPALVLYSFKPVKVLKGVLDNSAANTAGVRKVLVITQFAVSVMLITGTLVVSKQVDYIKNKNLGYNKENLVWFASNIDLSKQQTAVQEFLKISGVTNAAQASMTFVAPNSGGPLNNWPGKRPDQEIFFNFFAGGYDIIKTMGISMKEGRDFSAQLIIDSASVIINETAAAQMGLKDALGQEIETYAGKMKIVGVTKDFHFESMHYAINPLVIMCKPEWTWLFYVRATGNNMPQVLKGLEQSYAKLAPGFVFDYNFQDKEYERLYRSEQQIGTLVNWFSFFAIFISCLGLLGLTIFTVERKTKEIGIRKVLGASVVNIISLISKQFIWLILLAFVFSIVPAYFFMNNWLQNYAYRTNLSWWVFGIAGGIVVLIALLTVSVMAIKAAMANPVKSLRTE
jgi:ABC-type antimicrobial peptide transport system permease subunit